MKMNGNLNATVDLGGSLKSPFKDMTGKIIMDGNGLEIPAQKIPLKIPLTPGAPPMTLTVTMPSGKIGKLEGNILVNDGNLRFQKFMMSSKGSDIRMTVNGTIALAGARNGGLDPSSSKLDLQIQLNIKESFLNAIKPNLLSMFKQKGKGGQFNIQVKGNLAVPSVALAN